MAGQILHESFSKTKGVKEYMDRLPNLFKPRLGDELMVYLAVFEVVVSTILVR